MSDLMEQLQQLAELREDWNGYGEKPITADAIARCEAIHFSPTSDGGIQIELTDGTHDVEIVVARSGQLRGCSFDVNFGERDRA